MALVTVGIAYYGCPEVVNRAVRSVLAQTHRELVCVVVGDGETPPLTVDDDRLVVYTLPENHGAYFCEQLVLESSPHPWYAPMAADDWIEPDHLETLLALGNDVNVPESVCIHLLNGDTLVQKGLWEVGVFDAGRLRAIGGYDPSQRIEQDQLVMKLLRRTGTIAASPKVTYHQVKRRGSLTMAAETGLHSRYRKERRSFNRNVLHQAMRRRTVAEVRKYRESFVPAEVRQALDYHVAELRRLLAETSDHPRERRRTDDSRTRNVRDRVRRPE